MLQNDDIHGPQSGHVQPVVEEYAESEEEYEGANRRQRLVNQLVRRQVL